MAAAPSQPGLGPGAPIRFDADGSHLFLRRDTIPARIVRSSLTTGIAEPWLTLGPQDLAGALGIYTNGITLSADGKAYAYTILRARDELYLVHHVH